MSKTQTTSQRRNAGAETPPLSAEQSIRTNKRLIADLPCETLETRLGKAYDAAVLTRVSIGVCLDGDDLPFGFDRQEILEIAARLLDGACTDLYWLGRLPDVVLSQPSPDDDDVDELVKKGLQIEIRDGEDDRDATRRVIALEHMRQTVSGGAR